MNATLMRQMAVVLFAGVFAVFAGLASSVLPWWLVLPVFLLPVLVASGWRWPMVALVVVLLAVLGVLPVIKNKLVDAMVLAFMSLMVIVGLNDIPLVVKRYYKLFGWLAAFTLWVVLSAAYGHLYQRHFTAYIYTETSIVLHWLMFFAVALLARDERSAGTVLRIIIGLAVVLCLVSLAQSLFALRLNFSGESRVEVLDEASGGISGIKRSLVPGVPLVLFTFFLSLVTILRGNGRSWVWWPILMVTVLALFVSFGRALWAVTAVMSLLAAAMAGRRALGRFVVVGGLMALMLVAVLSVAKPEVLEGIINRMTSVRYEGGASSSLGWRLTENYFAIPQIKQNLLMGLGLGAEYKPRLIELQYFTEQTHYIHNGYLYVMLKMGLTGMLFYLGLYLGLLRLCLEGRLFSRDEACAPRIAAAAVLLGVLLLNVTQPELFTSVTITSLATLIPVAYQARMRRAGEPDASARAVPHVG